ncbi:hypothetical protein EVAR_17954_1 [Eumeta japonica]|uniref:Uncharacterized protein n=1 Tax=Eumeta variegata TaxID=151549 RepID=A0A4C1V095_EUMVA|nr:hypothetical protein EVAR_17954_1 [Eumeta japonica]
MPKVDQKARVVSSQIVAQQVNNWEVAEAAAYAVQGFVTGCLRTWRRCKNIMYENLMETSKARYSGGHLEYVGVTSLKNSATPKLCSSKCNKVKQSISMNDAENCQ